MSDYGKFSAVLNGNANAIAQFLKSYFKENLVPKNYDIWTIFVYESDNNWVVIEWPSSYASYGKTSKIISKEFQTFVSAIVYFDSWFVHGLFKNGSRIEVSNFDINSHSYDRKDLRYIKSSDPQLVATELKIDAEKIKLFQHIPLQMWIHKEWVKILISAALEDYNFQRCV